MVRSYSFFVGGFILALAGCAGGDTTAVQSVESPTPVSAEGPTPAPVENPTHALTPSRQTYYVAQVAAASDMNAGTTAERPFRTIQRAANQLQPGDRVLIGAGVYRECVRPPRGGNDANRMISYEAAPEAAVVITGADMHAGAWSSDKASPGVWQTPLAGEWLKGPNPFGLQNLSAESAERFRQKGKLGALGAAVRLRCGLVFQNGRRLTQKSNVKEMKSAGTFCVAADGRSLWVRPFDGVEPQQANWEVTARAQCFAPTEAGLGFIRVAGLTFEKGGNPFPGPARGLLSTHCGHGWVIEDNTIRQANSVGLDLGRHSVFTGAASGFGQHVVRRNEISDCGIVGISGLGAGGNRAFVLTVTENVLRNNCWHDAAGMEVGAAIKLLGLTNSLVDRNWIIGTQHGPAIWLDDRCSNTRCTGNTVLYSKSPRGAIFVELTAAPNFINGNVIWNSRTAGIYEHDSKNQQIMNNIIGHTEGPGIELRGRTSDRAKLGVGHHEVRNNVFVATKQSIKATAPDNKVSNNPSGAKGWIDVPTQQLTWQVRGQPAKRRSVKPPKAGALQK